MIYKTHFDIIIIVSNCNLMLLFLVIFLLAAAAAVNRAVYGQGAGPIVMDNVACTGTETSLMNCTFLSSHNCQHFEDAGVRCVLVTNAGKPTA